MSRRAVAILAAAIAAAVSPATARGEGRIVAGTPNRYVTPEVSIAAGERVVLANQDVVRHDVVAEDDGAGGEPLFRSPLVEPGGEADVAGADRLGAGSYRFLCSIHSSMRGTLRVTGTPAQEPPPPAAGTDTTAPELDVAVTGARLGRVARSGLPLSVRAGEPADVALRVTVRVRGRRLRLGAIAVRFEGAAGQRVRVSPTRRARRALRGARSATFAVTAVATDAAGNRSTATARRRLRR